MNDFRAVLAFSLAGMVSSLFLPEPHTPYSWPLHQDLAVAAQPPPSELAPASSPVEPATPTQKLETESEASGAAGNSEVQEKLYERDADRWLRGVLERSRE